MLPDPIAIPQPAQHIHTETCYQETGKAECCEWYIIFLLDKLTKIREDLRKAGAPLDRAENSINNILNNK